MGEVLLKALGFILVISIGFFAKKWKILKKDDGNVLATIIMNITLPCALLSSVGVIEIDVAMLTLLILGVIFNVAMVFLGYLASSKYKPIRRSAYMINCSGYNIGNFTLPFVQSFFPGMGVAYVCMFDVGNAIMCLGGTFAIALAVCNKEENISVGSVIKRLTSSIPFMVYIVIFILSVFSLSIPTSILSITNYIGNANGFLVMLMIGLLLEIKMDRRDAKDVILILGIRFISSGIFAALCYWLLPLPILARKILVLSLLAPVSTMATVFSRRCGYEKDMPAVVNSLSIIISVILNVIVLMVFV